MLRLLAISAGIFCFQSYCDAQDDGSFPVSVNLNWSETEQPVPPDPEDLLKQIFEPIYEPEIQPLTEDPNLYLSEIAIAVGVGAGVGAVLVDQGWIHEVSIPEIPFWEEKWQLHEWELNVEVDYDFSEDPFNWNDEGLIVQPELEWKFTGDEQIFKTFIQVPIQANPDPTDPIFQIGGEIKF